MAIYKGFSTVNKKKGNFTLTDVELIKQDILNTFHTTRGERAMRADEGTDLGNSILDPSGKKTKEEVLNEVIEVIKKEPRVVLQSAEVTVIGHYVIVAVVLTFLNLNITEELYLKYRAE